MTRHNRNVVLWSGGLDSTVLLHELALKTRSRSVVALTVSDHMGADKGRFIRQARARWNYLRFAKRIGLNIEYQEIQVTGSALVESYDLSFFNGRNLAVLREWQVFIPWVLPFLRSGDKVHLGYEAFPDDHKFSGISALLEVYAEMVRWSEVPTITIPIRPFSYGPVDKITFSGGFKRYNIPRNCVSSCEKFGGVIDCLQCDKCQLVLSWSRQFGGSK